MKDCYGRNIDYLRISITDKCNLRCRYCMPENGISLLNHAHILRYEEIYLFLKAAVKNGIKKVRITGGEPLTRRGIVDFVSMVRSFDKIEDIAITTNGILLPDMAKKLKNAGLDRVNISLDTLDSEKYFYITRGGSLKDALLAIDKASEYFPVKINSVLIKNFNENEFDDFVLLAMKYNMQVRFIEKMPVGYGAVNFDEEYVSCDELVKKAEKISCGEPFNDGVATVYPLGKERAAIGFITPLIHKFCTGCNKIRLTSDGKVKTCLFSQNEYDIKPYINSETEMDKFYKEMITKKEEQHFINNKNQNQWIQNRDMNKIGG